jgi:hypothetical protein
MKVIAVSILAFVAFQVLPYPPTPEAGHPAPPALEQQDLIVAATHVGVIADELPRWEEDRLARYERAELAAVRADVEACKAATNADEFQIDVEQLTDDLGVLLSVHEALSRGPLL